MEYFNDLFKEIQKAPIHTPAELKEILLRVSKKFLYSQYDESNALMYNIGVLESIKIDLYKELNDSIK